jgi:hypothetical protein
MFDAVLELGGKNKLLLSTSFLLYFSSPCRNIALIYLNQMNTSNIAIATISWARNREEKDLLQASLQTLAGINLPLFITDAGSETDFTDFVKNLSNTNLTGTLKGVWPQARQSIQAAAASGAEWILYTEPDKLEFFKQHLKEKLHSLDLDKTTGVYLFSRDEVAFQTFPAFQQMTETTIKANRVIMFMAPFCFIVPWPNTCIICQMILAGDGGPLYSSLHIG